MDKNELNEKINTFMDLHGIRWVEGAWPQAQIGPGWWPLLQKTLIRLKDFGWNGEVHTIKQKLGSLRIYLNESNRELNKTLADITEFAYLESFHICEICGKTGSPRTLKGYITIRCDEHLDPTS